jgi:ABC-type amino acid transport system permease subunit
MDDFLATFLNIEVMRAASPILLQGLWMTLLLVLVAVPLGLAGGVLRLGLDSEALRRELGTRDTLDRLAALASEVAGGPLTLEVGPVPPERAGETPLAQARQRQQESLADPLVQAAVEIFGAEVRGVRERRPRREGGA